MTTQNCPKCGKTDAIVEYTVYQKDLLEEVTCPSCGYYESKINPMATQGKQDLIPDDFEF